MSLLALIDGEHRGPRSRDERGRCSFCDGEMRAKIGQIVCPHWAHLPDAQCDPWSEPESDWHRQWKSDLAEWGCELEVTIEQDGVRHRADLLNPHGTVIELQHSYLSAEAIAARETFYGSLVWIYDARSWWHEDRIVLGRELPANGRGFWFKNGGKSLACHRYPVLFDLGGGHCARVQMNLVPHGYGERLVGKAWFRKGRDTFSWLRGPVGRQPRSLPRSIDRAERLLEQHGVK